MKYNSINKPLVCMQKNSTCYKETREMKPVGVLWHSTGANNPYLKRYIQPLKSDNNYNTMIKLLGVNAGKNDYNSKAYQSGLNAWIGKLENNTVTTVQSMPWNYRPWGCGSGKKGSCNNGWIQFEICEDNLKDEKYFNTVYKEACELTAYLCKMYGINPKGTTKYNGINVPTILCHAEAANLGVGSNHGDVLHWFSKYGKTMNDVRNDVANLMENIPIEEEEEVTQEQFNKMMDAWLAEQIKKPGSDWSAADRKWAEENGLMGGDQNGNMMYKKFLTREEFAVVLHRAIEKFVK